MTDCEICGGEGWVCEDHPFVSWDEGQGCCGGAGVPCPCNTSDPPFVNWAEVICEVGEDAHSSTAARVIAGPTVQ
jgi:hypothetical protein